MFRWFIDEDVELRLLTHSDAETLFSLLDLNRSLLEEWLPWLQYHRSVEDSRAFIRSSLENYAANKGFTSGVWYQGKLAGVIGYHPINWANRKVGLGYWVGQEFQGKGLAKKATRALVEHAFTQLKLNRVEILCATGNTRSQKVARGLGFKEEGILRQNEWLYDHFVDHVAFAMLKDDWKFSSDFLTK